MPFSQPLQNTPTKGEASARQWGRLILGVLWGSIILTLLGLSTVWANGVMDGSISDIAALYENNMSRPFFPETALWLPFGLQIGLSVVLILLMVFLSKISHTLPKTAHLWVMALTLFIISRHLLWRGIETLDFNTPANTIMGFVVFGAELLAFFTLFIGYFQMIGLTDHKPISIKETPLEALPKVDILVCTYNEPVNVLYRSLVGCLAIEYPHKTIYLCDDGNRPEMADLAKKLNVKYIARAKNTHAKAGNMNHAMDYSQNELILVFDADHVPCKSFLNEVIGFFQDDKLAFIQTPQHFFTTDPFQRNLASEGVVNNEQDLFFHVIEPGNDYWDAAFFAGSGAIFRRHALEEIGRFAVETITEDVHTGLRLHSKGWKSLYYNRDLSAGMAQDSFSDYIKQRIRWGRGMVQILFFDNPLWIKGLNFGQRLCYFAGIWHFFQGLPRIIFLIAPLGFLLFSLKPVDAGFLEVFVFYAPSFVALVLGYSIVSRGLRQSFWSEVYETAICTYLFQTNLATLLSPKRAQFRVTPKESLNEGLSFHWQVVTPQIIIGLLIVFGMGVALFRAYYTPDQLGGIVTNVFWSIYNLILILGAIYVAQERPQFRLSPRIFRDIRCELKLLDNTIAVGYTTNLSESGLSIVFDEPIPLSGTLSLKLLDWDIDELSVFQVQAVRSSADDSGKLYASFRIVNRTEEQHQQLIRHMFGNADVWEKYHTHAGTGKSFLSLLTTPFRLALTEERASRRRTLRVRQALSCTLEFNGHTLPGISSEVSETGLSVHVQSDSPPLQVGHLVTLHLQWDSGRIRSFQAEIKRVSTSTGEAQQETELGLNFIHLTREQRLDIIHHLYHPTENLIRVAPTVPKMVPCTLKTESGLSLKGITHEISEMGAVIALQENTLEQTSLEAGQLLRLQLHWNPETTLTYPAAVQDTANPDSSTPLVLVYFKEMDLRSLDRLSKHLHDPSS